MRKFITFNTLKKAKHYVKHLNAIRNTEEWDEHFSWFTIKDNKVLHVYGWQCGCGCGRASMSAKVVGRIKPNQAG